MNIWFFHTGKTNNGEKLRLFISFGILLYWLVPTGDKRQNIMRINFRFSLTSCTGGNKYDSGSKVSCIKTRLIPHLSPYAICTILETAKRSRAHYFSFLTPRTKISHIFFCLFLIGFFGYLHLHPGQKPQKRIISTYHSSTRHVKLGLLPG